MPDLGQRLFKAREAAKLTLLNQLRRRGLDITRNPFSTQLKQILDNRSIAAVLDVGANIGQYGATLRSSGFTGRIVSCEPQSAAYELLTERAAKDSKWTALNTAAGATPGSLEINISANSFSSSFLPTSKLHLDIAPASRTTGTETVPVTTVDALIGEHGLDPARTMLKVDTQGFEDQVLDGADASLPTLAAVQLEMSLATIYEGQKLFDALYARMLDQKFTLYALEPGYADPRTGQLLWCDGVFVRET